MKARCLRMHLITYGKSAFDVAKFSPIKNKPFVKPEGGLWASPIDSKDGWVDWCKCESFGDLTCHFTFWYTGNVLKIDSLFDAETMPWYSIYSDTFQFPDFEVLVSQRVDAIWLTPNGQRETRFSQPYSLYGWDCESVLVMNPSGIEIDS